MAKLSSEKARLFVAIEIPEAVKKKLRGLQEELKRVGAGVKWTDPGGVHLTLKFLGGVEVDRIGDLVQVLEDIGKRFSPFWVRVGGTGAFPNPRRPRVLWVGIEKEKSLWDLQRRVEEGLQALGFPKEDRAFSPHLTLGRIRNPKPSQGLTTQLQKLGFELDTFPADRMVLMRSDLKPQGAVYTLVREIYFGTS